MNQVLTTREYARVQQDISIQHDIEGNKLHIGCGYFKLEGFINIDKAEEVEPDRVVDMEQGLPFPDNHFSHVFSYHVLEHIKPDKWQFVLEEIYRVCKDSAIIEFGLPTPNPKNFGDIDHYRCFWFGSFCHNEYKVGRNYYMKFVVKRLNPKPNILWRWICNLVPSVISNVYFKFEVVKEYENKD